MNLINELTGNRLRIVRFLYRQEEVSPSFTRNDIAGLFYVTNKFPGSALNPDDDINFLVDKGLIKREEKKLWLTVLAIDQFTEYQATETDSILTDIINVDYEFALLGYLDRRNEFVNTNEFPKILE